MQRGALLDTLALFYCVTLLSPGRGERFFEFRNHRDQDKFNRNRQHLQVENEMDAEVQLEKYGYLRCKVNRRRRRDTRDYGRDRISMQGSVFDVSEESGSALCSEKEIKDAIKQYQRTYKLPETGLLDENTKTVLSSSRCGNKDSEKAVVNKNNTELGDNDIKNPNTNQQKVDFKWNDRPPLPPSTHTRRRRKAIKESVLLKVLAPKPAPSGLDSRKKYLHDYIEKLKKEDPMMFKPITNEERQKRSVVLNTNTPNGLMFNKESIKWRLLNTGYSTRIPAADQRSTIDLAFRMWSEVIPLKFVEDTSSDISQVDIEVAFGRGSHQNCAHDFDGNGGELAHSWHHGNIHLDDEENYKCIKSYTPDGIYLLRVAVHEIGHVLGLAHTSKGYSIMFAIYNRQNPEPDFELGWEDRKDIQKIYGVCKGKFNTVFDWVRRKANYQFIFNTYFFRDNHYWMYENQANRTRYGDPLYISPEWTGVPNAAQAYTHVFFFTGSAFVDEAFFFKGENVYRYDSYEDRVADDWPRLISSVYDAKPNTTERIPDNLDSVFFDMRDRNIYFFKDEWVYVYDPKLPEEDKGCCVRKTKIQDEYPALENELALPNSVDAVYYSYKDRNMYFIKDEDLVDITQLGLFNLTIKFNKMYFEADDVVSWINQYWDYMKEGQAEPTPRHKRGAKCLESFDNHKTKFKCGREIKKRMSWWALRIRLPPQPPTIILPSAGVITDEVMNSLQMKGKRTKTFVPVQCLSPVPLRCKRKSSLDLEEVVEVKSKKAKLKLTEAIKNSCETKYSLNQNYKGYYGRICSDEFERSSICKLDSIIPRPVSFDGHNHPFKTVLEKQDELKKSKMKAEILNFYQNADDCITDTIAETESHTSQSSTVSSLSSPSVESSQPANNATETESLSSDSSLLTTSDKSRGNSRRGSRSSLSRTSNCDQASPQQTNGQISPKQFKSLLRSPDVVDKAAIDAVSSHEVNIRQLQSRVSNYFGAADRLAQGEKFRVLARRESADKKVQYLVEWEGVMV